MTWTLWRGQELIGAVVPRRTTHGRPGQVSGFLVPRPGVALPKSGSQHRIDMAGLSWVQELPTPDLDGPERPFAFELKPHPTGTPLGIPPEEQLSVRSATTDVVRVRAISTHEHRLHAQHPVEEVAELPDGAIVEGSVWLVDFWME